MDASGLNYLFKYIKSNDDPTSNYLIGQAPPAQSD